jgi:hypothetical protein
MVIILIHKNTHVNQQIFLNGIQNLIFMDSDFMGPKQGRNSLEQGGQCSVYTL